MKQKKIILAALIIFSLAGCATTETGTSFVESGTPEITLFWPPPPQTARIQYLKTIAGPADIGVKKTWFSKAIDTILGKDAVEGLLLRPYGISANAERLFIADPGIHALHVFDTKNRKYFAIHSANREDLMSPVGVAVDKNGDIYFSDSILRKIFVFNGGGEYLRSIVPPEAFIRPTGISLDEDRVYIIDTHAHAVFVFSKRDAGFLFKFGKNGSAKGEFNFPTHIFIGKDNRLYITDSMNFRVQVFDRDGTFFSAFGKHGDGSGDLSKPKGVAVDSEGHIYVVDADFDVVQIFDVSGRLLLAFGGSGTGRGELFLPAGIFIDENDKIYVADSYNSRVQIFQYLKEMNQEHAKQQ